MYKFDQTILIMRNFLLVLLSVLFINTASHAQRVAVDSAKVVCDISSSTGAIPFYLQQCDKGTFWGIYISKKTSGITHNSVSGEITIQRRDTGSLAVIDSMIITGAAAIQETENDAFGNLYILAYATQAVQVDNNTTIATDKHFLVKLNAAMQVQWVNDSAAGDKMAISPDGNHLYVAGDHKGFSGTPTLYVLNSNGMVTQTKALTGLGYIADIKTNNNGDIFFSGACSDQSAQLDTVNASHSFSYDLYYGKIGSNLTAEWIKIMEDFTCPQPWLNIDANGNLLFYSQLNKSNTLGQFTLNTAAGNEFIFASTTPSGNVNFANDAPGATHKAKALQNRGRGLTTLGNNAAVMIFHGGNNDTINWSSSVQTISNIWTGQATIIEYDINTGQPTMATIPKYGTFISYRDIMYLDNGDLLVTNGTGDSTLQLTKLRLPSTNSIKTISTTTLKVYPNPTSGVVHFSEPISGSIYDIVGKQLSTFEQSRTINITTLPSGVYYIRTIGGVSIKVEKL